MLCKCSGKYIDIYIILKITCLITGFWTSLDFHLEFVMAPPSKDVLLSVPTSTSATAPPAVDVSAHHSCSRCAGRMSSIKYDRHTICLQCRDVQCSFDIRCSECSAWLSEIMQDYLKHRKSLVSKGKKKPVSTAPSSLLRLHRRFHQLPQ